MDTNVDSRLDSIDLLRAAAIMGMVLCHFVIYTSPAGTGDFAWLNLIAGQIFGAWPAALFLFVSGMSFALSYDRQLKAGKNPRLIQRRALRRGIGLFLVGLLFAAGVWSPEDVFDWDILTTIATALLLLYLVRNWPTWSLILVGILPILFNNFLFEVLDGASYWEVESDFATPFTLRAILVGYLIAGYFPVLPWVGFALIGYAIGRTFLLAPSTETDRAILGFTGGTLCFLGLSIALIYASFNVDEPLAHIVAPLHFYPLSPSLFLLNLGLELLLFWFIHVFFDLQPRSWRWLDFFRTLSRYSLTIYVLHHMLLLLPQRLAGLILEGDQFALLLSSQEIISPPISLSLAVIALLLFYGMGKAWDRHRSKYSLEWLLARAVG
jgi:uncharacterized membrane protein